MSVLQKIADIESEMARYAVCTELCVGVPHPCDRSRPEKWIVDLVGPNVAHMSSRGHQKYTVKEVHVAAMGTRES